MDDSTQPLYPLLPPPYPALDADARYRQAAEPGQDRLRGDATIVRLLRTSVADALTRAASERAEADQPPLLPADRQALAVELVRQGLRDYTRSQLAQGHPPLTPQAEDGVAQAVLSGLFGVAGLQPLLDEEDVENINVNGHDRVFVRRVGGRTERVGPVADSDEDLIETIRILAARAGVGERRFDPGRPVLNLQLPDGSRLFAVMSVARRPCVAIRRHRHQRTSLTQLVEVGSVSPEVAEFLARAVRARRNILICGGTGAGKTTLLRALAGCIDRGERLVTVEDTYELLLDHDTDHHPDCVALQARPPNVEGVGGIDEAELVRHALRMSPDRVIVGEVRGPELVPMLNAMSQGSDGSMGTIHASTARGAITKLAAYGAQAPERLSVEATNLLVAAAVHLVVHLAFDRANGRRTVASVVEVTGADGTLVTANELYRPGADGLAVPAAPPSSSLRAALHSTGPGDSRSGGSRVDLPARSVWGAR